MSKTRLTYFANCLGMALAMNWASGCSAPASNDPQGTGGSNSSTAGTTGNGGNSATAGTTGSAGNSATAGTTGNGGNASGGNPGTGGSISTAGTTGSAGNAAGSAGAAQGRGGTTGSAGTAGQRGHDGPRRHHGQRRHTGSAGTTGAGGHGCPDGPGRRAARQGGRHDQHVRRSTSTSATCASSTTAGAPTRWLQRHAAVRHVNSDKSVGWTFNRRRCGGSRGDPDFPEVEFGVAPFGTTSSLLTTPTFSSTTLLPIQLKDLQSASVNVDNFSISFSGSPPYWDNNVEFWISKNDPRTSTDGGVYAEIIMFTGWHASRLQHDGGWPCDKSGRSPPAAPATTSATRATPGPAAGASSTSTSTRVRTAAGPARWT